MLETVDYREVFKAFFPAVLLPGPAALRLANSMFALDLLPPPTPARIGRTHRQRASSRTHLSDRRSFALKCSTSSCHLAIFALLDLLSLKACFSLAVLLVVVQAPLDIDGVLASVKLLFSKLGPQEHPPDFRSISFFVHCLQICRQRVARSTACPGELPLINHSNASNHIARWSRANRFEWHPFERLRTLLGSAPSCERALHSR